MKLPEIKRLAQEYSMTQLQEAADKFEGSLENLLEVQGEDDGDKLTNLLMAIEVRQKMDNDSKSLNEAVKEIASRVRKVLS